MIQGTIFQNLGPKLNMLPDARYTDFTKRIAYFWRKLCSFSPARNISTIIEQEDLLHILNISAASTSKLLVYIVKDPLLYSNFS